MKDSREHPVAGAEASPCRVLRSVLESCECSLASSFCKIDDERSAGVECATPPPAADESRATSLPIVVIVTDLLLWLMRMSRDEMVGI